MLVLSLGEGIMADLSTLEGFHKRWVEVFNSHDLDAHAALYTEDAMLFGSVPELMIGRDAIKTYFGGRGPKVHVAHYPFPHIVMISDSVAATAAHVDFADGDIPMPYRVTWMLVKHQGEWRIAQHHGSPRG
jgi:uncharacterized protein (TIGR02246 family)